MSSSAGAGAGSTSVRAGASASSALEDGDESPLEHPTAPTTSAAHDSNAHPENRPRIMTSRPRSILPDRGCGKHEPGNCGDFPAFLTGRLGSADAERGKSHAISLIRGFSTSYSVPVQRFELRFKDSKSFVLPLDDTGGRRELSKKPRRPVTLVLRGWIVLPSWMTERAATPRSARGPLVDQVRHFCHRAGRRVRHDAVAEVEDVARRAARGAQHLAHARVQALAWGAEQMRIQVALHRHV